MLMGYRYYDPGTGRFLTRDPIGTAGGANLYAYVDGDPVNWADPWGLTRIKFGGESYNSHVGDQDRLKGKPHYDGPRGQWIDRHGKVHDRKGKRIGKVNDSEQKKIDKDAQDYEDKGVETPEPKRMQHCPSGWDRVRDGARAVGRWANENKGTIGGVIVGGVVVGAGFFFFPATIPVAVVGGGAAALAAH